MIIYNKIKETIKNNLHKMITQVVSHRKNQKMILAKSLK